VTPKSEFLEARGLRFRYLDWGGEGEPLVLLHGLASSSRIWDFVAPALARRFRVVAIDQRGHGLSDSPDSDYTFEEVGSDLAVLLRALEFERPALVGHSWGASVALYHAAGHPENVQALVLVDGGMTDIAASLSWEAAARLMTPPPIDGVDVDTFVGFARNWPHVRDTWSPQLQEMILSNFLIEDGKVYRRLPVENHMKVVRAIYDLQPASLYPEIRCPVLLVPAISEPANDRERVWQAYQKQGAENALRLLPDARLNPMRDTGHDIPIQRPQELAAVIRSFLEGRA